MKEWVVANRSIISSRIVETAEGFVGAMSKLDWDDIADGAGDLAGALGDIASNLDLISKIAFNPWDTIGEALGAVIDFVDVQSDIALPGLQAKLRSESMRLGIAPQGPGQSSRQAGNAVQAFPGRGIAPSPTRQASISNAQNLLNPATQVTVTLNAPAGTSVDSVFTSPGAKVTMKGAQRTTGGKR